MCGAIRHPATEIFTEFRFGFEKRFKRHASRSQQPEVTIQMHNANYKNFGCEYAAALGLTWRRAGSRSLVSAIPCVMQNDLDSRHRGTAATQDNPKPNQVNWAAYRRGRGFQV